MRFQSSPALSDGRYPVFNVNIPLGPRFQSSPALSDGRYDSLVPIVPVARLFQSSPALSDGRYMGGGDSQSSQPVSILARPFGRALR